MSRHRRLWLNGNFNSSDSLCYWHVQNPLQWMLLQMDMSGSDLEDPA